MLILTRGPRESIRIGEHVKVTVTAVAGHQVKLAFEAPKSVVIMREEIYKQNPQKDTTPSKRLED